jgi:hypothetical protein
MVNLPLGSSLNIPLPGNAEGIAAVCSEFAEGISAADAHGRSVGHRGPPVRCQLKDRGFPYSVEIPRRIPDKTTPRLM